LLTNGKLRCYLGYVDNIPVTTAAILNNDGIASLEFTVTLPEYRQKGLAKAVCRFALDDAFKAGVQSVSIRSFGIARQLGKSLGFRYIDPTGVWNTTPHES
jgi:GNAT superfamily N-acetyltransferase